MKDAFSKLNIILRAIMELGIVLASVYWGLHTGKSESTKIILGISTPILIFGFWGLVDFHNACSIAEILRLLQEFNSFISGCRCILLSWPTCIGVDISRIIDHPSCISLYAWRNTAEKERIFIVN